MKHLNANMWLAFEIAEHHGWIQGTKEGWKSAPRSSDFHPGVPGLHRLAFGRTCTAFTFWLCAWIQDSQGYEGNEIIIRFSLLKNECLLLTVQSLLDS